MTRRSDLVIVALCWVLIGVAWWIGPVRAQEKPVRDTRMWKIADHVNDARVAVIDTEGVCLYVVSGTAGEYGLTPVAIAAVPKTQLPKGTGCQ